MSNFIIRTCIIHDMKYLIQAASSEEALKDFTSLLESDSHKIDRHQIADSFRGETVLDIHQVTDKGALNNTEDYLKDLVKQRFNLDA